MFERLIERVRERMETVTLGELRALEEMLGEVPGVNAVRDGDRVLIEGRGLGRRMIEDSRLRGAWR